MARTWRLGGDWGVQRGAERGGARPGGARPSFTRRDASGHIFFFFFFFLDRWSEV